MKKPEPQTTSTVYKLVEKATDRVVQKEESLYCFLGNKNIYRGINKHKLLEFYSPTVGETFSSTTFAKAVSPDHQIIEVPDGDY